MWHGQSGWHFDNIWPKEQGKLELTDVYPLTRKNVAARQLERLDQHWQVPRFHTPGMPQKLPWLADWTCSCTMLHYVALCCTMLHYTTGGRTGELLNALESIQVELRKEKPALLSAMTRAFRVEARLPSWAKPVLQSAPRITRWIPVNPVSFPSGLQHCVGEVHQWLSTLRGSISAEQDMTCMTHGHTWTYMVKHGQAFSQAIQHQPIQCHAVRAGGKPCNDVMLMRGLWTLWSTQASKQKRRLWAALYVLLLKIETVQSWDWRIALVISWNSSKNLHRKS